MGISGHMKITMAHKLDMECQCFLGHECSGAMDLEICFLDW